MTHADKGKYYKKHPDQTEIAPELRQNILQATANNNISCARAEAISRSSGRTLRETGTAIDILNINIIECQLGLFGCTPQKKAIQPAAEVSTDLKDEIGKALISEALPCAAAWEIARKLKLPRLKVSSACESLKIKIKPCQLGAF